MSFDLVIRNGLVIDGSGAAGRHADVGVSGDHITAIGRIAERGRREIDAEGQVVSPGFIDGHTHMDAQVFWDPLGANSCFHGVTTAVMGNCGFSIAPIRPGGQSLVARNLERAEDIPGAAMNAAIDWSWEGFDQYLDVVDRLPKGINYAAYVGHSALRTWAMGERAFEGAASEDEISRMAQQLRLAMDAGAMGFSTSRSDAHEPSDDRPVASRLADWTEVRTLLGALQGRRGAMFEIANEAVSRDVDGAGPYYERLGRLSAETGVTFTFGVLGGGRQLAGLDAAAALGGRMIGQTHSRGVSILLSFKTALPFDRMPAWKAFRSQPLAAQAAGLRDPEIRARLVEAVRGGDYGRAVGAESRPPEWDNLFVYDKPLPPYRSIAEIAAARGIEPIEAFLDEALAKDLDVFFIQPISSRDPDAIVTMMRHPRTVMTFSDAGAHVSQVADASIQTHLLAYWQREQGVFTLPEAINLITGRVASAWGLADRGLVREGHMADLNIFDPLTIAPAMPEVAHDLPTGARRILQKSNGILATIVGGEVTLERGEPTGALSGRLLRRADA